MHTARRFPERQESRGNPIRAERSSAFPGGCSRENGQNLMNTVLYVVLSMSAAASILIGLLLLSEHLFGKHISLCWQYWLWALVVVRLLIPGGPAYTAAHPVPQTQAVENTRVQDTAADKALPAEEQQTDAPAVPAGETENGWRLLAENLWVIWGAGVLVLAIRRITAYQSFVRCLKAGMQYVEDTRTLNTVSEAAERLHLRRSVETAVNPIAASPLLIGFFHPCIILPSGNLTEEELTHIAVHELIHLRRGDPICKWIVQAAVCVHWFNPLVHYMAKRTDRLGELSCDAQAVRVLGDAQGYGATLLHVMAACGRFRAADGTVELSANKRLLKERLERMKMQGTTTLRSRMLALLITAALVVCSACTATYTPWRSGSLPRRDAAVSGNGPLLSLHVKNCYVEVEESADTEIQAAYDQALFDVQMEQTQDGMSVTCTARRTPQGTEHIILYVPGTFRRCEMEAAEGLLSVKDLSVPALSVNVRNGVGSVRIAENAAGTVETSVAEGLLALESADGFADADVEAQLHESVLSLSDELKTRFVRTGRNARLENSAADLTIGVEAEASMVCFGMPFIRMLSEWTDAGNISDSAFWRGVLTGAHDADDRKDEGGETGETSAQPAETAPAHGGFGTIADGVRAILDGVGSGVSGILSGVGDGVGEILSGIDAFD